MHKPHEHYMSKAIELAFRAQEKNEVPIGALLVLEDEIIAEAHNQCIMNHDPTAHAEILTLRHAGQKLNNYRLLNTTLYVTLEPCAMCAGAMIHARISHIVFGASDPKAGAIQSKFEILKPGALNHNIQVTAGILDQECGHILRDFFRQRR